MIHIHTIIVDEKLGYKMYYEPHNSSPSLINSPLMWVCRKIWALKWNKSLQNSVVCLFDSAAIFVKLSHRWLTLAVSVLTSNFYVLILSDFIFRPSDESVTEICTLCWKLPKFISNKRNTVILKTRMLILH